MKPPVKVRICKAAGLGTKFPYASVSKKDSEFIKDNLGNVFEAKRNCMNYYRLTNGVLVHIYNATEVV